jgi:tetratricopeptide (TPR) repeat protein
LASAQLALGEAYDRLGLRVQAVAAYDAAIKAAPVGDPLEIRDRASLGIRRRPDTRVADAYRFSLEGWRQFERGDAATASVLLERALRLAPGDFGARSRYGRVLSARQQDAYALAELERAFASQAGAPPTLVAAAFLEAGALHERGGRRSQAAAMYRSAARVFGSGAELHATAMRALDRVAAQDE